MIKKTVFPLVMALLSISSGYAQKSSIHQKIGTLFQTIIENNLPEAIGHVTTLENTTKVDYNFYRENIFDLEFKLHQRELCIGFKVDLLATVRKNDPGKHSNVTSEYSIPVIFKLNFNKVNSKWEYIGEIEHDQQTPISLIHGKTDPTSTSQTFKLCTSVLADQHTLLVELLQSILNYSIEHKWEFTINKMP